MAFNVKAVQKELEEEGALDKRFNSFESAREEHRKIQQTIRNAENEIAYAILTSEKKE